MATKDHGRIPVEPAEFNTYMKATDNRQLLDDPDNAGHPLYEKYTWTEEESDQWTAYRNEAETLFLLYNTEATYTTVVRDSLVTLIRNVNEFDHDRDTGHHLLDKVALYGNITDWEIYRVKRLTALADETVTESPDLGTKKPLLTLRSSSPGVHEFAVTNPDTPKSKALPAGVAFTDVYRCIYNAEKPPTTLGEYTLIGVPTRGIFLSKFEDQTFDRTKKYYASYMARYRGKSGEIGLFSNELIVLIDDTGGRGIVN
jgi:hypothetical protein